MVAGCLAQNKGRQCVGVVEAKASGCIAETAKWPNMGKQRHMAQKHKVTRHKEQNPLGCGWVGELAAGWF